MRMWSSAGCIESSSWRRGGGRMRRGPGEGDSPHRPVSGFLPPWLLTASGARQQQQQWVQESSLDAAIESLLNVEKLCRLAGDMAHTRKAAVDIVKLCFKDAAWKTRPDRRPLQAQGTAEADICGDRGAGKIDEAADFMHEAAVVTFGSMEKTKKAAFILEQVRLCLDCQDYIRVQILSSKISPRVFNADTSKKRKKHKEGGTQQAS